jgi:hypothetical protein
MLQHQRVQLGPSGISSAKIAILSFEFMQQTRGGTIWAQALKLGLSLNAFSLARAKAESLPRFSSV